MTAPAQPTSPEPAPQSIEKHVRNLVHQNRDERHKTYLLEQFYLTLRVTHLGALQEHDPIPASPDPHAVHQRIHRLFAKEHSWRNAYEIEQLLALVLTEAQLATELERRIAEARALKLDHLDVIENLRKPTTPLVDRRILLHRLLNDLQWLYSKRFQHRNYCKRLLLRVSSLFVMALVTLVLVLFIQFFAHSPASSSLARGEAATRPAGTVNPRGAAPLFSAAAAESRLANPAAQK